MAKPICERCWISLILRIAMASLFIAAAVPKWMNHMDMVTMFQGMFKDTWLPMPLVTLHAMLVPYIEVLIPIWLIVGYQLRLGWIVTALFLVSLAFGMSVVQKGDVALGNYLYVMVALAGLYFSQFDRLSVDAPGTKGS